MPNPDRRADRRPVGAGPGRERHAGGEGRHPASGADRRPAGIYVFVVEDGKAAIRRIKTAGEVGPTSSSTAGLAAAIWSSSRACRACAPARAVRATPVARSQRPELSRCCRPFSSTGRGWRSSSPSSPPSPGCCRCWPFPVAQYPDIVPPQVSVTTTYPGAIAGVVEATVAQPIEAQVVGVDKMMYMKSVSGDDGSYSLTVSFELGTNPDINTVNVNNRVQVALSKPAAGRAAAGRHGQEEVVRLARASLRSIRRSARTIRCSSPTTSPSTCSTGSRARPASATPRCGARRITPCAPGFAPTG